VTDEERVALAARLIELRREYDRLLAELDKAYDKQPDPYNDARLEQVDCVT
jgi:hypothetical protein